jgi:hypothetical protein
MIQSKREIWAALLAILMITAAYAGIVLLTGSIPAARNFFGHSLGILGFLLMLMTETLYTLRKRSTLARWGRTANWLRFHIFTGLVGPYLVLLHTAWQFRGLAAVALLLTVVIVISGIIGRYIYTAVPRTLDGAAVEAAELERQILSAAQELQVWLAAQPGLPRSLTDTILQPAVSRAAGTSSQVLNRTWLSWRQRWRWNAALAGLDAPRRRLAQQLLERVERRSTLQRQAASLRTARQLLATWHTIHIPIGMALFAVAFIHVVAALYYATFLH